VKEEGKFPAETPQHRASAISEKNRAKTGWGYKKRGEALVINQERGANFRGNSAPAGKKTTKAVPCRLAGESTEDKRKNTLSSKWISWR